MRGGGGVGKKPKKIHARQNAKKKIHAKKKVKNKFMQKEGPIVTFSHSERKKKFVQAENSPPPPPTSLF